VGVGHINDVQAMHLSAVDATVWQPGDGVVAYLDEEAVGALEIERELLGAISRELVTSRLGKAAELSEVGGRDDLTEPQLDLLGTLDAVAAPELLGVVEQALQTPAVETDFHSTRASWLQTYTQMVHTLKC